MVHIKLIAAAALLVTGGTVALAKSKEVSIRDQQQAACYADAQRLCGDAMPDVDKTIACMEPKKALVSAACAAFYK